MLKGVDNVKEYDVTLTATDYKKKQHRKRRKSEYKYKKHLQKIHSFGHYPPPVDIISKSYVRSNWSLFKYAKKYTNRIVRRKKSELYNRSNYKKILDFRYFM